MNDVDIVIPYVDSTDENWQKLFNKYNPIKDKEVEGVNARNRFRGQGEFFRYWFRCVERNLPFIRKIHLIVQSESQVPTWINREKVHIVYHSDIIPEEYLPTFNSTCIEMFLWKIDDLSEKFLYANDDFYVIQPLKDCLFFNDNKVCRSVMYKTNIDTEGMYQSHCRNCFCLINDMNKDELKHYTMFRHSIRPYLKSKMIECYKKYEKEILDSISMFRENKNFNIYLHDNYLVKNNLIFQQSNAIRIGVIDVKMQKISILRTINASNLLAIQDTATDERDIYKDKDVIGWFTNYYSNKSIYELDNYNMSSDSAEFQKTQALISKYNWYKLAIFKGWCSKKEYDDFMMKNFE